MNSFIELSRHFRELKNTELEEPEILASLNEDDYLPADDWLEILKYPRVLLLAEAGSGKTAEMREQVKRLATEKEYAFFVALESLDRESLIDILSAKQERSFEEWKADGHSPAWFFLDAVDELKLTRGKLERALDRFTKAVDGLLDRTHVVISCRPNDWRPDLDMATVQEKLPLIPTQSKNSLQSEDVFLAALRKEEGLNQQEENTINVDRVLTVVMLPMSENQIELFSSSLGVKDTSAFIAEIRNQNAWVFARRPLDCSELVAIWNSTGKLGTRAKQHKINVENKLKDDPGRADSGVLPDSKARLGAERLALALALTRTRTIRSPEQSLETEYAEGVLNPTDILNDWTEEERQALLRRALFDPATYGRVRFHHSSVQEYLAACRLHSLRNAGMSIKTLNRFLFARKYGVDVVLPSMQAIAAWLALWNEGVRRELMLREPEILLSLGDPEALPLEAKARLVRAFATAYGNGGWRGLNIPINEVKRLANPELSGVIRDIWNSNPVNDDVRELLLELIWQGAIGGCADIVESAANDVELSSYHRVISIRALIVCDRLKAVRKIVNSIITEQKKWPEKIIYDLATDLFPHVITVSNFIALVKQVHEPEATASRFSWSLEQIAQTIEPLSDLGIELRDTFTDLVWSGRDSNLEFYKIKGSYNYLTSALAILCDRQLSSVMQEDHDLIRACVIANRFEEKETGTREPFIKLKQHFAENLAIRKMAFWVEMEIMDELITDKDSIHRLYNVEHNSLIGAVSEIDREWFEEALTDTTVPNKRAVALEALIRIWVQRGRLATEANELQKLVIDDNDLSVAVNQYTAPVKPNEKFEKMERERQKRKLEQGKKEQQRIDSWLKWREELLDDPDAAFCSNKLSQTVNNLYKWLRAYEGKNNRYNMWNIDALTHAFGSNIASLAVKGFQKTWRLETPVLWSRRPAKERNSTLWSWIYGLCGIAAEAASPDWAKKLTSEEAQIAAAYSTVEINGFPSWLVDLVEAYPSEVDLVLGDELTNELEVSAEYQHLPVLQELSHSGLEVKKLLAQRLLTALQAWGETFMSGEAERFSAYHLSQVINILDETCTDESRTMAASVCNTRFVAYPNNQLSLVWLRGLFRFDLVQGVQALENRLQAINKKERVESAIEIFASLFGNHGRLAISCEDSSSLVSILSRLIRCAYMYVRREDDLEHEGAYTPNTRDNAESARNFLLSSLLDVPGPEARSAILELAAEPLFAHFPDRLRLLARRRSASDAEFEAFSTTDLIKLETRLEAPPNDRDGLFNIMVDRLDDIAHDITHDDFTDRRTLRTINKESEMQLTLARRLKDIAKGMYVVIREDEVADLKRTDIRLAAVSGDQKSTIEIKLADKRWSLTQLERALRNQLVGQYLRHKNSKAGCLLLTYDGEKNYWKHPETGDRLNFSETIEYLKNIAKNIEKEMHYEVRLIVYGLDLTDPILEPVHS